MPGKVIVFSYGELAALIRRLAATIPTDVQIDIVDAPADAAVLAARECMAQHSIAAFLSSGGMYRALSREIPVGLLEITVTGFDFLLAVKQASRTCKNMAVIHYTMMPFLAEILDVLAAPVKQVNLQDPAELDKVLAQLKREGIEAVIGGSLVCEKAAQLAMGGFLVYSTESVMRALSAAIAVAQARFIEAQKAEELRAILDFSHEGIVAVDRQGWITAVNPSAEKLLGINRQTALGRPAAGAMPQLQLDRVLTSRRTELNQVESIGGTQAIVNRIPIIIKEELTGALATIHDAGSIQQAEAKIRNSLRQKSFRAKVAFKDIRGDSPAIQRARTKAALFARTDSAILLQGESGTGKELFAQAIHNASQRARRPFVAVNCAALPESLLESELFGYAEGAFTGARKGGKPGLFELAHQGTLFLDEVSSLPIHLQAKLLRVLQEKEVMRVGADYMIPLDVRILAASNQDLRENIKAGTFRSDLYYRLSTLDIRLPPLRERREDILPLFLHFAQKDGLSRGGKQPGDALAAALRAYAWPGNIRELGNVAEKFMVLAELDLDPAELLGVPVPAPDAAAKPATDLKAIAETAQIRVIEALEREGAGRAEIAALLGISRTGLWKKLKRQERRKQE